MAVLSWGTMVPKRHTTPRSMMGFDLLSEVMSNGESVTLV